MEAGDLLFILGRLLLGGLFVLGGIKHFMAIPAYTDIMISKGVVYPKEVLILGSAWQAFFGILFIVGLYLTVTSLALVLFTIIATYIWFPFWKIEKGPERDASFNGFTINLSIIGGLLIAA